MILDQIAHPSGLLSWTGSSQRKWTKLRGPVTHIRVHDLRHTTATTLLEAGVHPKVVQNLLGHSTIAITLDTYSHVAPTLHLQAVGELQSLLASANVTVNAG